MLVNACVAPLVGIEIEVGVDADEGKSPAALRLASKEEVFPFAWVAKDGAD